MGTGSRQRHISQSQASLEGNVPGGNNRGGTFRGGIFRSPKNRSKTERGRVFIFLVGKSPIFQNDRSSVAVLSVVQVEEEIIRIASITKMTCFTSLEICLKTKYPQSFFNKGFVIGNSGIFLNQ